MQDPMPARGRVEMPVGRAVPRRQPPDLFAPALLGLAAVFALRWAADVFNTIPYFGAVIVACGVAMAGFLQSGSILLAAYLAAATLAIRTVEGFLLTPWLMGRAARMNAVAMF